MTRVAIVEWPDGLEPRGAAWSRIVADIAAAKPDLLVTNELPFGPWIAASTHYDAHIAARSVAIHERGMAALAAVDVPAVLSSRPVPEGGRLANEAVAIEDGTVRPTHRKQYFPAEPGWHETDWYATVATDFTVADIAGLPVGVLLCTELMFNEHARHYGRAGAALIAVPRASGVSAKSWHIAAAMASLVSGAYVVSSSRIGGTHPEFGGAGFAYAPGGELIGFTSRENPIFCFELDSAKVALRQADYPCNVAEISR
jgi:N-carbamoylputrescine amidase